MLGDTVGGTLFFFIDARRLYLYIVVMRFSLDNLIRQAADMSVLYHRIPRDQMLLFISHAKDLSSEDFSKLVDTFSPRFLARYRAVLSEVL